MQLTFIDFFAGIGGMRAGFEKAGWKCLGFCEYDRYARQSYKAIYNTEGEWENHDIRTASSMGLPKADLWTYGFPCQGISVAGARKGIGKGAEDEEADERSNLFYQIIRLLQGMPEEDRPEWLLCENVRNILSIDRGFGMLRVLCCLDKAGYDSEWQIFNTKHSYIVGETIIDGIPQNRERVYIVSHLRRKGRREVFPVARADGEDISKLQKIGGMWGMDHQAGSIFDKNGLSPTIKTPTGGSSEPYIVEGGGQIVKPVLTPDREEKRQNGRRIKDNGEPMFTLTTQDRHGVAILKKERTEYGKQIRKEYEAGNVTAKRTEMQQYTPREDGISNTLTTVEKDNYLLCDAKNMVP